MACERHHRCKLPPAYRATARTRWPTEPPRPRPLSFAYGYHSIPLDSMEHIQNLQPVKNGHNSCKLPAAYRTAARTRWPTEPPRPRPSRGIIGVRCQRRTAPLRAHGGQLSSRAIISIRYHSPLDISYKNENLNESSRIFEQFFMHAIVHNALIVFRLLYR